MDFHTKNDIIYQILKDKIIDGVLKPGERIIITDLAAEFNVSPMPVREAIKRLQQDEYVEVIPHIGAKVASMEWDKLREILLILTELEVLAAKLAAPFIGEKEVNALNDLIQEMEKAVEEKDNRRYAELNKKFHSIIYGSSPYKYLNELIMNLWNKSEFYRTLFTKSESRSATSLREHKEWLKAIIDKDAEKVQQILRQHKESAYDIFFQSHEKEINR
ncbi:DNA-binding transcriptional regulator, GntR family [Geosporobacter subterraneus DSM 17957]|uniref:DNA-binding transcriptional regulator, GntR family n=1 Tax=Geosporobacter subterraneus DSM 17957 TaxID=1121919 RepID=A0A1M6P025_9FIRM|nr:GntR family transcriptional regulator [Geosporobacter subterraneus]SHK01232.1 DNA-binding transcriptional regulator, GntR family [Geosporobacter subterraneus DSM 17957]